MQGDVLFEGKSIPEDILLLGVLMKVMDNIYLGLEDSHNHHNPWTTWCPMHVQWGTGLISCMFVYMFASIQEIQRWRIQPETAFPAQEDLFIQDRLRLC